MSKLDDIIGWMGVQLDPNLPESAQEFLKKDTSKQIKVLIKQIYLESEESPITTREEFLKRIEKL